MVSPATDPVPEPLASRLRVPAEAEVPPRHHGLVWRTLDAGDTEAVLALGARCDAVDASVIAFTARRADSVLLGTEDAAGDTLGGFSSDGKLRAMARVSIPLHGGHHVLRAFLFATIDPQWRGRGIGRALLDWQDARARQLLAADGRDLPARIAAYVDEHQTDRRKLYVAAGFSPKRVFQEMRRPTAEPLPEAPSPAACSVVDFTADLDDAVRQAHNEAYRHHWGFTPQSPEAWARTLRHRVPAWSKVALHETPEGPEVVGYALTSRHEELWPQLGFSEGYTELLGVRADHRRHGLAQAMLAGVIASLRADGIESAGLDVDVVEAAGPQHFYERLGYMRQGARVLYTIEM